MKNIKFSFSSGLTVKANYLPASCHLVLAVHEWFLEFSDISISASYFTHFWFQFFLYYLQQICIPAPWLKIHFNLFCHALQALIHINTSSFQSVAVNKLVIAFWQNCIRTLGPLIFSIQLKNYFLHVRDNHETWQKADLFYKQQINIKSFATLWSLRFSKLF